MTVVNHQTVKEAILGDKFSMFMFEFPDARMEIQKFKNQPTCGTCERTVIPKLYANPKYDEKIKLIFGNDVQIDKTLPAYPPAMAMESKIFRVPLIEWDKWFIEFTSPKSNMQVRQFSTFLDKDFVVFSCVVVVTISEGSLPPPPTPSH